MPIKKNAIPKEEVRKDNNSGLKKRDLFNLRQSILNLGDLPGKKFSHQINRNLDRVNDEIKEITDLRERNTEKVKIYLELVEALQKENARKDVKGQPKIIKNPNGYSSLEILSEEKYLEDLAKLKKQYPEESAQVEADEKELEEILDQPAEFEIYAVQYEDIPDSINPAQYKGIKVLIEGDDL